MIRRAEVRDIPELGRLLLQVHAVHAQGRPDIFVPGERKYTDAELETLLHDENKPVFIYTGCDDRAIGYAFCQNRYTLGERDRQDRKTVYIDDLCVDESRRGGGIGKALYQTVLNYASENGFDSVELNVWCLNTGAMAFYEKLGMKKLKITMEQEI